MPPGLEPVVGRLIELARHAHENPVGGEEILLHPYGLLCRYRVSSNRYGRISKNQLIAWGEILEYRGDVVDLLTHVRAVWQSEVAIRTTEGSC